MYTTLSAVHGNYPQGRATAALEQARVSAARIVDPPGTEDSTHERGLELKKNYRIYFTGSHGTGKTTQRDYFRKFYPEFHIMEMERRDLHAKGIINLNKRVNPWDEVIIAGNVMLNMLSTPAPSVSDRSWVCKCAYCQATSLDEDLKDAWHIINTRSFFGQGEDDVYIYFPPVIPLVDDGVRSMDPEYQSEVDYWVQFYLDFFHIKYHTMNSYTVQDRHFELEQVLFGGIK